MKYLLLLTLLTACAPRALQSDLDVLRNQQNKDFDAVDMQLWRLENRIARLEPVYRMDTVWAPPLCGIGYVDGVGHFNPRCYRIDSVRVK